MGSALITRKGGFNLSQIGKEDLVYAIEDIPANNFVEYIQDNKYLIPTHLATQSTNFYNYASSGKNSFFHYKDNQYIFIEDTSYGYTGIVTYLRVSLITITPGENFSFTKTILLASTKLENYGGFSFGECAIKLTDDLIICYYNGTNSVNWGKFLVIKINANNGVPYSASIVQHSQQYQIKAGGNSHTIYNENLFKIDNDKIIFVCRDYNGQKCRILYFTFNSSGVLQFIGSASLTMSSNTYIGALYEKNTNHLIITTNNYAYKILLSNINGGVDPGAEDYIPEYVARISFAPCQYNFIKNNCYYGLTNSDSDSITFKELDNSLFLTTKTFDRENNISFSSGKSFFDEENEIFIISGHTSSITQWFSIPLSDLINSSRINFKTFNSGLYNSSASSTVSPCCYCHDNKYYYLFQIDVNGSDSKDYLYITQYTTIPQCRLATNNSTSLIGISKKNINTNSFGIVYTK